MQAKSNWKSYEVTNMKDADDAKKKYADQPKDMKIYDLLGSFGWFVLLLIFRGVL